MDQKVADGIKEYLFGYLKKSQPRIEMLAGKAKFDVIINDAVKSCYDGAVSIGSSNEGGSGGGFDDKDAVTSTTAAAAAAAAAKAASISVLATGLLHYLLTASLITSQRKIDYNNCAIDIVVPDVKTLKKDPKKALLLCIPDTADLKVIGKLISELEKVQPQKENIWLVLSKDVPVTKRKYVLAKENSTFANIVFDISKFTQVNESNKFKILKI